VTRTQQNVSITGRKRAMTVELSRTLGARLEKKRRRAIRRNTRPCLRAQQERELHDPGQRDKKKKDRRAVTLLESSFFEHSGHEGFCKPEGESVSMIEMRWLAHRRRGKKNSHRLYEGADERQPGRISEPLRSEKAGKGADNVITSSYRRQ